ncbi:MAG TPA: hypothetical protein PK263_05855, partial [bacterium]|nr:hypothetical protein [bacterium]
PFSAKTKTLLRTGNVVRLPTILDTWLRARAKLDCNTVIFILISFLYHYFSTSFTKHGDNF